MNKDTKTMLNHLLDAIQIMIEENNKKLRYNYYVEGVVLSNNSNGTYNVEYNGRTLTNVKCRDGLNLNTNDIVLICVVNGNFSNKFIDLKRP